MSVTLILKTLRDLRVSLLVVALLLCAFQILWAKINDRISNDLMPQLIWLGQGRNVSPGEIEQTIFGGPGKIFKTMMGGEDISLFRITDMLSVGYVHPLMITIFCIWAIGRSAGAVTGEIDRGTMELLLAQPVPRYRVILSHFGVDLLLIPILCFSLWAGNWLGITLVGIQEVSGAGASKPVDPAIFGVGLLNVAVLLFAVGGYTMWLSARGRFRGRVLGIAILATLLQYLINVVGQMWDAAEFLRPFTVFYYFQPQQLILHHVWSVDLASVWHLAHPLRISNLAVLAVVGLIGYSLALTTFCRRDLPAPL